MSCEPALREMKRVLVSYAGKRCSKAWWYNLKTVLVTLLWMRGGETSHDSLLCNGETFKVRRTDPVAFIQIHISIPHF